VPILGEFALWISLPVAIWGMVLGYAGGRTQRGDLVLSAERSIYAVFGLLILASAGVSATFLGDRFEYWYVASYSNADLELFYKVTGLWAGQRGSLLFWALLLGLFASIAVFTNRTKNREFMPYVAGVLQSILLFFIVVLLFADVNPFERLPFTPADGQGLNPQLQNYWMTIHPPTLYLGFTAFTIPFAFAVAALLNGRLDARWIQLTRRWILTSWLFLSVDRDGLPAFDSDSGKPWHVEGLEHVAGAHDVPAHDFRDVPDALRADRVGAFVRSGTQDRVHLPELHGLGACCMRGADSVSAAPAAIRESDRVVLLA
jgi:cytochrome c biogenesis factor